MYWFYTVQWGNEDLYYVGKVNDGSNNFMQSFWKIHFYNTNGNILPWDKKWTPSDEGRWEKKFKKLVVNKGFKRAIKDITITSYNGEETEKAIKENLDNFANKQGVKLESFYDRLKTIFGYDDPAMFPELLLMCAFAVQKGIVLNMNANYIGSKTQQLTRDRVLNEIITSKVIDDRNKKENKYIPKLWLTLQFEKKDLYDENGEKIKGHQRKIFDNNKASVNVFEGDNREKINTTISHKIQKTTIKFIKTQLIKYADKIDGASDYANNVAQKIRDFVKDDLQNLEDKQLKTGLNKIEKIIRNAVKEINKKLDEIDKLTPKKIVNYATILQNWMKKVSIKSLLQGGKRDDTEPLHDSYKRTLTKLIQDNVFGDIPKNKEYTAKQAAKIGEKKRYFLPKKGEEYTEYLVDKTRQKLPDSPFMREAWFNAAYKKTGETSMYREQVSIWLGDRAPFNHYHNYIIGFASQPTSQKEYKKIQVY